MHEEDAEPRLSRHITPGATIPENENIPLYIGHSDSAGLHNDYNAPIGSLETDEIGSTLDPVIEGATRQSPLQSNTGAEKEANVKLIVNNFFIYEMKSDDHYPPSDWATFARRLQRYYRNYNNEVIHKHRSIYVFVTTQDDLVTAMKTEGKIGLLNSIEGMPKTIDVPVSRAAERLRKANIQVVNLMWNHTTDVGHSHTDPQDNGLKDKGKELLKACTDVGIPVFDVSHASEKTALDMIQFVAPYQRVIASHTGARIGNASERSRNITDKVAQGIMERDGIVGVAAAATMLGGNSVYDVVRAIEHFVRLDPTRGRLVTLGVDLNGIGIESKIEGAATVLELRNIAEALHKAGFSQEMVENIFWRNAYDFWYATFAASEKLR